MEILQEIPTRIAPIHLLLEADPCKTRITGYINDSSCFAAYLNKKIVGVCIAKITRPDIAEIFNIAIASENQAQGIGTKLLRFTLQKLSERSVKRVFLGTGTFGHQLSFYQRQGFRVDSIVKNHFLNNYRTPIFENGIQHKDMLRLVCQLSPSY